MIAQTQTLQYHFQQAGHSITVLEAGGAKAKVTPERDGAAPANPALAALRDHFAAELAREYIRLMEDAARDGAVLPTVRTRREG